MDPTTTANLRRRAARLADAPHRSFTTLEQELSDLARKLARWETVPAASGRESASGRLHRSR